MDAFSGMINVLFTMLNYTFTFLGVEFTLLDIIFYSAIMGVFAFFIKNVVFFWRDKH